MNVDKITNHDPKPNQLGNFLDKKKLRNRINKFFMTILLDYAPLKWV